MKVLATTPYHKFYTYTHPQDSSINWSFLASADPKDDPQKPGYVVMAPVIEGEDGEKQLVLQTHIRPPRINTRSKGITVEVPAGSATDADSRGGLEENAKREILEETSMRVNKLHDICSVPAAVATHSGEGKYYVAECEIDKQIKPNGRADLTQLATFSVPLKQAMAYLMDLTKKGIDVSNEAFIGTLFALKQFQVPLNFADIPSPKLLWSIVDSQPNPMQKDGLELLKRNKEFLPEAAVSSAQPQGLLGRFFGWIKSWFAGN